MLDRSPSFNFFPLLNVSSLAVSSPSLCLYDNNVTCSVLVTRAASVTPSPLLLFPSSCAQAPAVPGALMCVSPSHFVHTPVYRAQTGYEHQTFFSAHEEGTASGP